MTAPLPVEVHVHVHIEGQSAGTAELKEIILATKEEVLASLQAANDLLVENQSDTQRIIELLDAAVAANDLTAVAEGVEQLRSIAQATNDAIEAAAPEAVEPPVAPTP